MAWVRRCRCTCSPRDASRRTVPSPERSLRGLTDAMVIEQIHTRYGGLPAEALANPEFLALLIPTLRADFAALEDFAPARDALPVPITAVGGTADACAVPERLALWQGCTSQPLRVRQLEGGHFYLEDRVDEVAALLRETLAAQLAAGPARNAA